MKQLFMIVFSPFVLLSVAGLKKAKRLKEELESA